MPRLGSYTGGPADSGETPSRVSPDLSAWARRANVDHEENGFFGRETFSRRLVDDLASRTGAWIVGVTGPGGAGKTAVAFEAVRKVSDLDVFDRILWTKVRGEPWRYTPTDEDELSWEDTVLDLADQLDVRVGPSRRLWDDDLGQAIRAIGHDVRILAVVDNLEIDTQTSAAEFVQGNPYLIKLIVQRFKSTQRPFDQIVTELTTSGSDVKAHLFDRSLREFDRRVGSSATRMLLMTFSIRTRGEEIPREELVELSGLGSDFDHVLEIGCALGLVQGRRLNTRYSIHGMLHEFIRPRGPSRDPGTG